MAVARTSQRYLRFAVPGAALLAVFSIALASAFVTHGPQGWGIRTYNLLRVRSASMQPTLQAGDTMLADMTYYRNHRPSRGDLAIYRLRGGGEELAIKRIVGVGGDRVLVRRGRAIVNGSALDEPYADFGDPGWAYNNTQAFVVPQGQVFVLGDNRANSRDSRVRAHGFVPVANLVGRATRIILTTHLARLGRWVGTP